MLGQVYQLDGNVNKLLGFNKKEAVLRTASLINKPLLGVILSDIEKISIDFRERDGLCRQRDEPR